MIVRPPACKLVLRTEPCEVRVRALVTVQWLATFPPKLVSYDTIAPHIRGPPVTA